MLYRIAAALIPNSNANRILSSLAYFRYNRKKEAVKKISALSLIAIKPPILKMATEETMTTNRRKFVGLRIFSKR